MTRRPSNYFSMEYQSCPGHPMMFFSYPQMPESWTRRNLCDLRPHPGNKQVLWHVTSIHTGAQKAGSTPAHPSLGSGWREAASTCPWSFNPHSLSPCSIPSLVPKDILSLNKLIFRNLRSPCKVCFCDILPTNTSRSSKDMGDGAARVISMWLLSWCLELSLQGDQVRLEFHRRRIMQSICCRPIFHKIAFNERNRTQRDHSNKNRHISHWL